MKPFPNVVVYIFGDDCGTKPLDGFPSQRKDVLNREEVLNQGYLNKHT